MASTLVTSSRISSYALKQCIHQRPHTRKVTSNAFVDAGHTSHQVKQHYRIQTAILLNRSPTLTRPPTPFEAAYQEYNARIARALFNPFPTDFYFKAGSILETQFMREESQRERDAFGWKTHDSPENSAIKDGQDEMKSGNATKGVLAREEEEVIMPRTTEADRKRDVRSLNRKGHRNLYLIVKKGKGRDEWRLPGGSRGLQAGELLHEAAQRELQAECGVNIDAWIVGRHPIGFMDDTVPSETALSAHHAGAKTFFFKAHILAGQVNPCAGSLNDFAWLTKKEIKRAVTAEYWGNIQDILSDF